MNEYEHTQIGKVQRWLHGGLAIICSSLGAFLLVKGHPAAFGLLGAALICTLCIPVFNSLTVQVSRNEIRLRYGAWINLKTIHVDDLQGAAIVR